MPTRFDQTLDVEGSSEATSPVQGDSQNTQVDGGGMSAPSIALPKGGGAIRGIGEKFDANPVTGTGRFTLPITVSPGRSEFAPNLSLAYDSGSGNGPFGFGWSIGLPAITRKTDKGLPRYVDAGDSDVFMLSGAEDLVPVFRKDAHGDWVRDAHGEPLIDDIERDGFVIRRYRPRIEGLFSRIERWTRKGDGDVHWRSISKDNILSLYGADDRSRIVDRSGDAPRVFSWLICESRDGRGNAIIYEYKAEDAAGADLARAHQRNRGGRADRRRATNRYLKGIRYGNRVPLLDAAGERPAFVLQDQVRDARWMFEVVLDFGEHSADAPAPGDAAEWIHRNDAFSTYRAGFEVRTARLCRRVLMFHHFAAEAGVGDDCLVRSLDFAYSGAEDLPDSTGPVYAFMSSVTQNGYRRVAGGYEKRGLPPLELEYSEARVHEAVELVDAESLENLPAGVDGAAYQWNDLHGEGIPGILTEQGTGWFYKRNISPISDKPVAFAPLEAVGIKPNLAIAGGRARFMDLAGDGEPDLVVLDGPTPGLYEHDEAEGWRDFRPFTSRLARNPGDPRVKFIDLDGDGRIDVLVDEDEAFAWHASLGEEGFAPATRVALPFDEEQGPRLVFADPRESIFLADMSGDGLDDLVRVRNGEVSYWPNLGYGNFGAKVAMDDAPLFDRPEQFDPRRIRLADIDGTGTTDLIYLHRDGVRLYFNESGNGWAAPRALDVFPRVDDLVAIAPADLLGNGTTFLVWSSPAASDARAQMRYVDLMGGRKPHLLVGIVNNLGAETRVTYAPSTKFYLADKYAGRPWITRLPFPVQVVERIDTFDAVSGNRFVTRYCYHHGHFDGVEREFRGFGMVEQWDTEEFGTLAADGALPAATNVDAASHVPPALTKTWFHTGVHLRGGEVSRHLARDYFGAPADAAAFDAWAAQSLLDDTLLPDEAVSLEEERQAVRALKGAMLRKEVYAQDGSAKAGVPYTVTEQNYSVKLLQPQGGRRHAIFVTHAREAVVANYERDLADPRIDHALTLALDDFGDVLRSAAVGYGRAPIAGREPDQEATHVTFTLSRFANRDDQAAWYRAGLAAETRVYEVAKPPQAAGRYRWEALRDLLRALVPEDAIAPAPANTIAFASWDWRKAWNPQAEPGGLIAGVPVHTRLRLIEHTRTIFRDEGLAALLPLGVTGPLALPGVRYKLAFTADLIAQVFRRKRDGAPVENLLPADPAALLEGIGPGGGGYVAGDGGWWIPSARGYYDAAADAANPAATAAQELATARQHFFLPRKVTEPFGQATTIDYDAHDFLVSRTRDPLGNIAAATHDYRVLKPRLVTDANRNRKAAAFDTLGFVVATAEMGKDGALEGDMLEGFRFDPSPASLQAFMADPEGEAPAWLGKTSTSVVYDFSRYQRVGQPLFAATLVRETHFSAPGGDPSRVQVSFSYRDGFGREIQRKVQAEPGIAPQRAAPVALPHGDIRPGDLLRDAQGNPLQAAAPRRWVGSGRTVYDNKGRPFREYEPYFSATHLYESEREMTDTGVSKVTFRDPAARVIVVLHPNDTYEKVAFNAWRQSTWDVNDTVAARGNQTGDPRTDPDVAGYVARFFAAHPDGEWKTWFARRMEPAAAEEDRDAASKAAVHADTPSTLNLDSLGRAFLAQSVNRRVQGGAEIEEVITTRFELDIGANRRAVVDARGRVAARYDYDLVGRRMRQASMDAGERWTLHDATDHPVRRYDSRRNDRRLTYDALRRETGLFVTENGVERLARRTAYGEPRGDALNHRLRVHQVFDGAGIVTSLAYDFKGNLLIARRDLLPGYESAVDWLQDPAANDGTFTNHTTYDAINRPREVTSPDGSVFRPMFNAGNLLDRVEINLRGALQPTTLVTGIEYNAKGQRERIAYGNGAQTRYHYDPLTFRMVQMRTTRPAPPDGVAAQIFVEAGVVQDLRYTYDPAGNLTRVADSALRTVFHGGERVDPVERYTCDALYRLVEAKGREHVGQCVFAFDPPNGNRRDHPLAGLAANPNDLRALRNYTQGYEYDVAGNIAAMRHLADGGSWTRLYDHEEASFLEPGVRGNRLTRTVLGDGLNVIEPHGHDAHGNMTSMAHLASMAWDFEDQLREVDLGGGGTAYYVYDAAGQRTRKVIKSHNGVRRTDRIYLGGFEIHREFAGDGVAVSLQRESLHVMDGKQRLVLAETLVVDAGQPVAPQVTLQRYQLGNHLGSAAVELDADAGLISREEYHPYGTTSFQAGRSAAEVSLKRYRFTGMERDEETGLNYHGVRYYAPWLGLWASADPVEAVNLYCYALDCPTKLIDQAGNQPQSGPYRSVGPNGEAPVAGDHVHQVASRTSGPGAQRSSAGQYNEALSVCTDDPSYNDQAGQRVESAFNRASWGRDYSGRPADTAGRTGTVTLESTGDSAVGRTTSATPSQWASDTQSFYKLREAGVDPDTAQDLVCRSSEQLQSEGATPQRVPQPPRSTPRPLTRGQQTSTEMPLDQVMSELPPADPVSSSSSSTPIVETSSAPITSSAPVDAVRWYNNPGVQEGVSAVGEGLQGAGQVLTVVAVAQSADHVVSAVERDVHDGTYGQHTARVVAHEAGGWAGALAVGGEGAALGLACGPFAEICSPVGGLVGGIIGYYSGSGIVDAVLEPIPIVR
jgi:RHS repeat-associated protein